MYKRQVSATPNTDEQRKILEAKYGQVLEAKYGQVWNTTELQRDFIVDHFVAGVACVTRKSDNVKGMLDFTHMPRFYFNFQQAACDRG